MSKHTKGEWFAKTEEGKWFQDENYHLYKDCSFLTYVMVGCGKEAVAIVPDYDYDKEQLEANAKLISAAPEMYGMIKYFASEDFEFNEGSEHLQKQLEEILKKVNP